MFIEILVSFVEPIEDVFFRFRYSISEQGFTIDKEDQQERTFFASSHSNGTRVDIKGYCFMDSGRTVIQVFYSPALTPVWKRPLTLKSIEEISIITDLEKRLTATLNATGKWERIDHKEITENVEKLILPDNISKTSIRSTSGVRLVISFLIVLAGLVLSYLTFIQKIRFVSS